MLFVVAHTVLIFRKALFKTKTVYNYKKVVASGNNDVIINMLSCAIWE